MYLQFLAEAGVRQKKYLRNMMRISFKKAPSYLEATFVMPDLILETYSLPKNADGDALSGLRSRNSKIVLFSMGMKLY